MRPNHFLSSNPQNKCIHSNTITPAQHLMNSLKVDESRSYPFFLGLIQIMFSRSNNPVTIIISTFKKIIQMQQIETKYRNSSKKQISTLNGKWLFFVLFFFFLPFLLMAYLNKMAIKHKVNIALDFSTWATS